MLRIGSSDLRVPWESYPLTACLCKQVRLIESSECGQQSSNHEVKFPTAPDWVNSVCLSPVPLEFSWLPQMILGPSYWPPHIRPSSLPIVQSPSHQGCCKCFLLGYCSSHCSVPKRWSNLSFQIFLYSPGLFLMNSTPTDETSCSSLPRSGCWSAPGCLRSSPSVAGATSPPSDWPQQT